MSTSKFKKVLLIDDNEIDNFINKKLISKANFAEEIVEERSASSALQYLSGLSPEGDGMPEIIFLDIMMPVVDGFQFLEEFDKFPEKMKNATRIIMLSSTESFKDLNRANSNKYVHKFLNKPLTEPVLEAIR